MLEMIQGAKIKSADKLFSQYEKTAWGFIANVHAKEIIELAVHFIELQTEPLFFILELPTNKKDEEHADGLHRDVYYMDGLSKEKAKAVLLTAGEWLVHDGLCYFGFASHTDGDELMFKKYNIAMLYTETPQKYDGFFEAHTISKTERLVTAFDTFSEEEPGRSERYMKGGKDIYSFLDTLQEMGLYFAQRCEE